MLVCENGCWQAAAGLDAAGLDFVVLEKSNSVGGVWQTFANQSSRVSGSSPLVTILSNTLHHSLDATILSNTLHQVFQLYTLDSLAVSTVWVRFKAASHRTVSMGFRWMNCLKITHLETRCCSSPSSCVLIHTSAIDWWVAAAE